MLKYHRNCHARCLNIIDKEIHEGALVKVNLIFRGFLVIFAVAASFPVFSYFPDNNYFSSDSTPSLDSALGDLDGDGDLDAFVTVNSDSGNLVFLNDGIGNLTDSGQHIGSSRSFSVKLGDLDGDGDLDAIVLSLDSGLNEIWLNNGKAVFSPGPVLDAGGQTLTLADLDGDGDLDVVTKNTGSLWQNDGHGNFTNTGRYVGGGYLLVALLDIDDDGDIDAVTSSYNGFNIYRNSGAGVFTSTGQVLSPIQIGLGFSSVGDIDGDGDLDIVVVSDNGNGSRILRNDGTGIFTDTTVDFTGTQFYSLGYPINNNGALLIDSDGDGDLDIFIAHGTGSIFGIPNEIWLNDGTGTFVKSNLALGYNNSKSVTSGDMNGDGYLDIYVTNFAQKNRVWIYDGHGGLSEVGGLGNEDSQSVSLGDLDGDGDLDAFVANGSEVQSGGSFANTVWMNNGDGIFVDSEQKLGNSKSQESILADLDGDGDLDAIVANIFVTNSSISPRDEIWFNDGKGKFTRSSQAIDEIASLAIAAGDIDNDGDIDIVISNLTVAGSSVQYELNIWSNNGAGVFSKVSSLPLIAPPYAVKVGDFNGDNYLDIFVGAYTKNHRIYLNDGKGDYRDAIEITNARQIRDAGIGDLDGDGDSDIFAANGDGENSVWLNDGSGHFQPAEQIIVSQPTAFFSVSLVDLDQDGDLDAFLGTWGANRIWLNDGKGYFQDSGVSLGNSHTNSTALGDLDSDGDMDAFVANGYQDANTVWFNQWIGPITHEDHRKAARHRESIIDPLENDYDQIGKGLTLINTDRSSLRGGSLSKNIDNTITYVPAESISGNDRFTYEISDGDNNTAVGVVQISLTEGSAANAGATGSNVNGSSGGGRIGLWFLVVLVMSNIMRHRRNLW